MSRFATKDTDNFFGQSYGTFDWLNTDRFTQRFLPQVGIDQTQIENLVGLYENDPFTKLALGSTKYDLDRYPTTPMFDALNEGQTRFAKDPHYTTSRFEGGGAALADIETREVDGVLNRVFQDDVYGTLPHERTKVVGQKERLEEIDVINDRAFSTDVGQQIRDAGLEDVVGKTYDQYTQENPIYGAAADTLQTLFQAYRDVDSASQKGGGLRGYAGSALQLAGTLTANPGLSIAGGAIQGALDGGSFTDVLGGIVSGFGSEFLAGKLGDILTGPEGSIWGADGGGVGPLGSAIETGTKDMSLIGDIFKGVKGGLGGLGDILSSGYNALGGGSGILGGLGDILSNPGVQKLGGSIFDYYTNKDANRTQQKASDQAIGLANPLAPYRQKYAGQLDQLLTNPQDFIDQDPSVKFRFDLGEEATRRKSAASGNRLSGAGILASQEFGQKFAETEYQNIFKRLNTLATGDPTSANIQENIGNSNAESKVAQYNSVAGGVSTIGGILSDLLNKNNNNPQVGIQTGGSGSIWENPYNTTRYKGVI